VTGAPAPRWFTARFVLFGDADAAAAVADIVAEQRVTAAFARRLSLSQGTHLVLVRDLGRALAGLLEVDVADLLVAGWHRHRAFRRVALASAGTPGSTRLVELSEHRIVSVHEPSVELQVDGRRITTVRFELRVTVEVGGLVAAVRDARLVEIRAGTAEVTATLSVAGVEVASRTGRVDARLVVRLGTGVALLAGGEGADENRAGTDEDRAAADEDRAGAGWPGAGRGGALAA
jgi:hypothetical protein